MKAIVLFGVITAGALNCDFRRDECSAQRCSASDGAVGAVGGGTGGSSSTAATDGALGDAETVNDGALAENRGAVDASFATRPEGQDAEDTEIASDVPAAAADGVDGDSASRADEGGPGDADVADDVPTVAIRDAEQGEAGDGGGGGSGSACVPHDIDMDLKPRESDGSNRGTHCELTDTGLLLTYAIDKTTWGGCVFGNDEMVQLFDADRLGGGQGVLEVHVCIVGQPATGSLNLYYGVFPAHRWLSLYRNGTWANGQSVTASQCMTLHFRPEEAFYPGTASTDAGTYPPVGCGVDADSCQARGPSCEPNGGFAPTLSLLGEWAPGETSGVVRLVWVRYYPSDCSCRSDAECTGKAGCVNLHNLGGCSDSNAAGVCADCIGRGDPCAVTTLGKSCQSSLVCVQGKVQCPCTPL
jgi:hypothetical protein